MKLIEPSFSIHTPFGPLTADDGIKLLRWVEYNARISHQSESDQTENSWEPFIKAVVLGHGDWSVAEHATVTAVIRVDRGITHELVRHRLFAYTQESTRFVRYKNCLEFIYPGCAPVLTTVASDGTILYRDAGMDPEWLDQIASIEKTYFSLLKKGWSPQAARSILPNALAATISCTTNLRNWRHMFLMRTSKESHPDFRAVSIPLLNEFKRLIPLLFDDIEPLARQIDNLRKPR